MIVLVLGAGGMIGHKMYETLSTKTFETFGLVRRPASEYERFDNFDTKNLVDGVDASDFSNVERVLEDVRPNLVLNCLGVTLRKPEIADLSYCLEMNSFLPQRLGLWCEKNHARLIQFSTDCVFDGSEEYYTELSYPSARDVYGRTKFLGEVGGPNCLTLRGSMIGPELYGKTELLEWVFSQRGGSITGFSGVIYSGVTTVVMAHLVEKLARRFPALCGLYQVSSSPISKYELIRKINDAFNWQITVEKDDNHRSAKVLISDKIKAETGFVCPSWDKMIADLAADSAF